MDYLPLSPTANHPAWKKLKGARLGEDRRALDDHQVSPDFAIQTRKLIDTEIIHRANIIIFYFNKWDSADQSDNAGRVAAFKAKVTSLLLYVKLSSEHATRNLYLSQMDKNHNLREWATTWAASQFGVIPSPRTLHHCFSGPMGEDFRAYPEEVQVSMDAWMKAVQEERHMAVLLAWLASTRETVEDALAALVKAKVVEAGSQTVTEAKGQLEAVNRLLGRCNALPAAGSEGTDDSDTSSYPPL
jgi:hypothetical protein